jgi:hypothetical protein
MVLPLSSVRRCSIVRGAPPVALQPETRHQAGASTTPAIGRCWWLMSPAGGGATASLTTSARKTGGCTPARRGRCWRRGDGRRSRGRPGAALEAGVASWWRAGASLVFAVARSANPATTIKSSITSGPTAAASWSHPQDRGQRGCGRRRWRLIRALRRRVIRPIGHVDLGERRTPVRSGNVSNGFGRHGT